MPIGGSITWGVGSTDGTGYRKSLLRMLQLHGLNVRMVGSRKTGHVSNNDHEGWRGSRIDEIERKARNSVKGLSPNVFMVNAGSNDCLQSFKISETGQRMDDMLEYLWLASPQSTVLLSTLLPIAINEVDSVVRRVNDRFHALAIKKEAENKKIVLVDMYTPEGPNVHGLVDGIHPDDDGYERMAKLWFRGIQEALQKGYIDGTTHKL